MGKDTVHFNCTHCGHCCTDVVCLPTPWDVIRLVRETGEEPYCFLEFVTLDEISEVAKTDPTWLWCNGQRYMMALRRKNGCHFLDRKTRFCRAYNARPILCRLYPFALHETKGGDYKSFTLHKKVGCPRHRDGTVLTGPLYDLYLDDYKHQQDYDDLVKVFNRQKDARRKPCDFIEMFYRKS